MSDGSIDLKDAARAAAWSLPLEEINPAQPALFQDNIFWPYFERLRAEDPVHFTAQSAFGPYWSITRYGDIMAVDTNHQCSPPTPSTAASASRANPTRAAVSRATATRR